MKNVWFWSDQHLGHQNMYKFVNYDGTKLRPWDTFEEAEEMMIQNYNSLVSSSDTVYFLGDIGTRTQNISYFMDKLCPCRRILIMGNHDNKVGYKFLSKYFNDIRGAYNLENYIMTHIPVSFESKARFKRNIHGHTHNNLILAEDNITPMPWYKNVCVERTNYSLISFEDIKQETEDLISKGLITVPPKGRLKDEIDKTI